MEKKTAQLQIRVTPRQKALIRQQAQAHGMDMTQWILTRSLPSRQETLHTVLAALAQGEQEPDLLFGDIFNLLKDLSAPEFSLTLARPPDIPLKDDHSDLLQAMVELAARQKGCLPPRWVREPAKTR